jgi:metacaspase-1
MAKTPAAKPVKKSKAQALHIGLNAVSAAAYEGWTGPLVACEFDAHDMAAIAADHDMTSKLLLTKAATRKAVLSAIRAAAARLEAGDLYFLTYSGHGGQVPDVTGEEKDKQDETWCLYDGQLIDDELYLELSRFKAGVRILVLSDSCHSGTVTRAAPAPGVRPDRRPKLMPPAVAMLTYRSHQKFYDGLQQELAKANGKSVDPDAALANVTISHRLTAIVKRFNPAVILISGCQDNQTSLDGDHNGLFTEQLLKVWKNGAFTGSYARFHKQILAGMPPDQSPNLFALGPAAKFLTQKPFQVTLQ